MRDDRDVLFDYVIPIGSGLTLGTSIGYLLHRQFHPSIEAAGLTKRLTKTVDAIVKAENRAKFVQSKAEQIKQQYEQLKRIIDNSIDLLKKGSEDGRYSPAKAFWASTLIPVGLWGSYLLYKRKATNIGQIANQVDDLVRKARRLQREFAHSQIAPIEKVEKELKAIDEMVNNPQVGTLGLKREMVLLRLNRAKKKLEALGSSLKEVESVKEKASDVLRKTSELKQELLKLHDRLSRI